MKRPENMEAWGRDVAQKRYGRAEGGRLPSHPSPPVQPSEWPPHPIKRADGGPVEDKSPEPERPASQLGVGTAVYDMYGKSAIFSKSRDRKPRVGPFPRGTDSGVYEKRGGRTK